MKRLIYIGLTLTLAFTGTGPALGQGPVPLTGEIEQKKTKTPLPPIALDAAREYLEIMAQLQDVIHDYADYIGELDPEARAEFADAIKRFSKGIQKGSYSSDCNLLVKDINAHVAELQTLERHLAVAKAGRKQQEVHLVENFRRELSMLGKLVSEDVSRNLAECSAHNVAIAEYLRAQLAERAKRSTPGRSIEIIVGADGDTVYVVGGDKDNSRFSIYQVTPPPVPPVPSVPSVPPVPGVVWAPTAPRGLVKDVVGSSHTLTGYMTYSPGDGPVTITVPTGDLMVQRATEDALSVTVSMEVTAKTRANEKAFISDTKLKLDQSSKGHTIDLEFPKLRDPDTRLLSSTMTVLVPDNARLFCLNSFGNLTIVQFDGDVTATGNHSTIVITQVDGSVSATNSMGSIRLERVDGEIEAVNSYGTIEITNCDAHISVENSYGVVNLQNSSGKAVIENSGNVDVSNYDGPVKVNNRNGTVDIAEITGSLIAYNSYQPLTIRGIDGDVKAVNANAVILASNITGRLSATNRYGRISVTNVEGPLDVNNEYGRIDLYLDEDIPTRSRISTTSDTISVWMSAGANILVNAETLEGNISSFFPIELSSHGERKLGIIKLGDGRNRMDLSGTYSSIVVSESR